MHEYSLFSKKKKRDKFIHKIQRLHFFSLFWHKVHFHSQLVFVHWRSDSLGFLAGYTDVHTFRTRDIFFFEILSHLNQARGVCREVLRGFTKSSWGSGGRCEPPSGVRGGAPEDFEINAFQRLRTPVSLSFLSQRCYTKIHAIFFIHSHPHHFQLNEVVPNHTL